MQSLRANIDVMHTGSGEISTAADDLSRRTEQQAASLEETAATLDEITTTVKNTAQGAIHAREVVSTAKSDADKSSDVVRQAIGAMGNIETRPGKSARSSASSTRSPSKPICSR
jgi:methyl-accepting chemotaxis protein